LKSGPIRPIEGEQITVLIEVGGVPVTHVATAGRVRESTMIVPRKAGDARWSADPQGQAVVLFAHGGRLHSWPMRVEEVLPSSYYLVSLRDPTEGERREFVRTMVEVEISMTPHGEPANPFGYASIDLSASGLRLITELPARTGDLLDLVLRSAGQGPDVTAVARVVRRLPSRHGVELAVEFVELNSADEDRMQELVFKARESLLAQRIGRREFS